MLFVNRARSFLTYPGSLRNKVQRYRFAPNGGRGGRGFAITQILVLLWKRDDAERNENWSALSAKFDMAIDSVVDYRVVDESVCVRA